MPTMRRQPRLVVGRAVSALWPHLGVPGSPAGTSVRRVVLEELGFFTGLGTAIVFFAALALGGCFVAAFQAERPDEERGDDGFLVEEDTESTMA